MKLTTIWNAFNKARTQEGWAMGMAAKSAGGSHDVDYYTILADKRERQGDHFAKVIYEHMEKFD